MQIIYDGAIFLGQHYGGINTYFYELWSRLSMEMHATAFVPSNREIRFQSPQVTLKKVRYCSEYSNQLYKWLVQSTNQLRLYYQNADFIHLTYYNLITGVPMNNLRLPVVLTVWDMIHELFPDKYDPDGKKNAIKKKAIMSAEVIICISNNTKKDLISFYNVPDSKIYITPLAPGIVGSTLTEDEENQHESPYFLYVGGRKYHKNFSGLLNAFARIVSKMPDVFLYVVGSPFNKQELILISNLRLTERIVHKGPVSDDELAALYSHSLALVYPSLYEGFGIPPLEAMSCGTVAVASNRSSIPEVVGNAAILFDPDLKGDLEDKLLEVYRSPILRQHYITAGREWAGRYTWEKTANQTFEVYNRLKC